PAAIRRKLHRIGISLNSIAAALCIGVAYRYCISFRYERSQLIPPCGITAFHWLNAKAHGDLEHCWPMDSELVREFGDGDGLGRYSGDGGIRLGSHESFSRRSG